MDMQADNEAQIISICSWIKKQFHTGSREIGGSTDASDYDYVATLDKAQEFCCKIGLVIPTKRDMVKYVDGRFMSLKYRTSEDLPWLNLILVMDELDLSAWRYATRKCAHTDGVENLSKPKRCELFESFMNDYYKSTGYSERMIVKIEEDSKRADMKVIESWTPKELVIPLDEGNYYISHFMNAVTVVIKHYIEIDKPDTLAMALDVMANQLREKEEIS